MKPNRMVWTCVGLIFASTAGITPCLAAPKPEEFNAYIQAWAQQQQFAGTVLVAKGGNVLLNQAYGAADSEKEAANTIETRYRIGSLTKAFTALVVLQLEQEGKLSTSSPLSAFLPDYPRGDEITLTMLLNHRSGIVDHTTLPDFQTRRRTEPVSLTETIATFKDLPLRFSPGTRFEYSSSNYILLGHIIEKVTGQSYADVVQRRIFSPLGMDDSGFLRYGVVVPDLAKGYRQDDGRLVPALDRVMQNASASGALYSTASDLYAWDRALYTDKLVNAEVSARINHPAQDQYANGWAITRMHDRDVLAHVGDTEGFKSFILRFVDDDACIIILSNFEHCPIDRIGEGLAAILFERPYEMPKKALADSELADQYRTYVGRYQLSPELIFTITMDDGKLFCQATGQPKFQLHAESETRFFIREFEASISFERDQAGNVVRLVIHQAGRDVPAERL